MRLVTIQKRAGTLEHFHIHLDEKTERPAEHLQPIQGSVRKHSPIEYIVLLIAGLCFLYPVTQITAAWYRWIVFPAAVFATVIFPISQAFGRANFILRTSMSVASVFAIALTMKYIFSSWDNIPYWFLFNTQMGLFVVYLILRVIGFDIRRTVLKSDGQRIPRSDVARKYQFSLAFLFQLTLFVAITIALSQFIEPWNYVIHDFSNIGFEWEFLLAIVLLMVGHLAGVIGILANRKSAILFLVSVFVVFGMQLKFFYRSTTDIEDQLFGFFFCASLTIFPLLVLRFFGYRWTWRLPWRKSLPLAPDSNPG